MRYPTGGPKIPPWTRLSDTIVRIKDKMEISGNKVVIVGTVGVIGLAFYMTAIQPKINHEFYAKRQKQLYESLPVSRDQIAADSHLPTWRDPFDRETRNNKIQYGK
uniref:Small integral membrane protein 20 n=1 Tax=Meloidogyne hapla TaxID=6305 RepID=A0A1I8BMM7_MELHA